MSVVAEVKDTIIDAKKKYDKEKYISVLEDYTFKYVDKNPIRNPYGRCGKTSA